jgi:hypothetical protein
MFVGEGPGADEDAKGEPFVGRAGQLLNNMIKAMGIEREAGLHREHCEVPSAGQSPARARGVRDLLSVSDAADRGRQAEGNRGPRRDCGQDAAGDECFDDATARALLRLQARRRSRSTDEWDGCKLAVTYHPAFLLRDPRQKGEAWKDLQMVMKELGMKGPKANA